MESKEGTFLKELEKHKGILYKIANLYCKDIDDKNDLIQEMILQLWKSFDTYNQGFRYSTWLYRVALNVAISFYRKEKVRSIGRNPITENLINISETDENLDKQENISVLYRAIAELRELDKALILLYLEEKNYKEIAEIIGISESNVGTKINRIKTVLKQKLHN